MQNLHSVIACVRVEQGGAERLVSLELSKSRVATLLKNGVSEEEIGLTALRETAKRLLGDAIVPWYFSYRVRLGGEVDRRHRGSAIVARPNLPPAAAWQFNRLYGHA